MPPYIMFKSHDPGEAGPKLQAIVQRDLGSAEPIPFSVIGAGKGTGSALGDMAVLAFSGSLSTLFEVEFRLPGDRPVTLNASIFRILTSAYCGTIRYAAFLNCTIDATVELQRRKWLVFAPKFLGGASADKLNAVPGLAKLANSVVVAFRSMGGGNLRITPIFRLQSAADGTWLLVATLGRGDKTLAANILELAQKIEATLA